MVSSSGHRANSLQIKKVMPKKCQSLFFSATFPEEVVSYASKMVNNADKATKDVQADLAKAQAESQKLKADLATLSGDKESIAVSLGTVESISQKLVLQQR